MRERFADFLDVIAFIAWHAGMIAWRMTQPDTPVVTKKPQAPVLEPAAVELPDAA